MLGDVISGLGVRVRIPEVGRELKAEEMSGALYDMFSST